MIFGHSHPLPLHRNTLKDHRGDRAHTPRRIHSGLGPAIMQNSSSLIVQKTAASKNQHADEFHTVGWQDPTPYLFPISR